MPRQLDFAGAAELAVRLRPSTARLVVISGSGDLDRRLAQVAREQLAPYAKRMAIEYWQDAPLGEFLRRIAQLGRDDAVLYLTISRDAEGRVFTPVDVVQPLAAASPAPIYGPFETYVGEGIVAGTVYSFESRGRRMGELVHEALSAREAPPPPAALDRDRSSHVQREAKARHASLTARERSVFEHVVAGKANKEIARALGITERTVKMHRAQVMAKMQAGSLAELVRMGELLNSR